MATRNTRSGTGKRSRRKGAETGRVVRHSFYVSSETLAELRGAADFFDGTTTGPTSMSDIVDRAIRSELRRLARLYHGGEPFPAGGPRLGGRPLKRRRRPLR